LVDDARQFLAAQGVYVDAMALVVEGHLRLRGKWSPRKAILPTLEPSFLRHSFVVTRVRNFFHQSDSPGRPEVRK